jgi:hypothetical protein
MAYKKYHLISGIMCLLVNIVLPTFIYHLHMQIKSQSEMMVYGVLNSQEIVAFSLLFVLGIVWLGTMLIALHELGGYMVQLGNTDPRDREYTDEGYPQFS